jgi:small redox-active disulfide protein 2
MENKNIKIKVLGSGCTNCKKLYELVSKAVEELNLQVEVEYITDMQKIVESGLMKMPAVLINDKPVLSGRVPDLKKIKNIIEKNTN